MHYLTNVCGYPVNNVPIKTVWTNQQESIRLSDTGKGLGIKSGTVDDQFITKSAQTALNHGTEPEHSRKKTGN